MKKFTILTLAMLVLATPAFGQNQRSEREQRRQQAAQQQAEELEARYRAMIAQLSRQQADLAKIEELRDLEQALARTQAELHDLDALRGSHGIEDAEVLEQMLQEQRQRVEQQRHRVREMEHNVVPELHELDELTRQEAEAQALRHDIEQLDRRHEVEAMARQHALQVEQAAQRHQIEAERAARILRDAESLGRQERERAELLEERLRREVGEANVETELDRLYRAGPRASWDQQDPADSLWRAARDNMNRGQFREASRLFARIHNEQRYRQSTYRADALYWNAFALNRIGTRESVRESLDLLERLNREYPEDQRHADTNALLTTVQGRLAEMGNTDARRQIRSVAVNEARIALAEANAISTAQAVEIARQADAARSVDVLQSVISPLQYSNVLLQDGMVVGQNVELATALNYALSPSRLRSLSPQCARDEAEIQLIALNSLVRMDSAAAAPVLREVMARRDECSAPLRQSAMTIIARMETAEADRILVEAARNDPDTGVRRTALVYLSTRNETEAVGIAEQALQSAQTAEDRQWVLQALARMRTDRAWAVVRDYASRSDLPVDTRRSAIAILSSSNDEANTAFLRQLYTQVGNDRTLKEAILMSSAFRRGAADPEWLLTIARDGGEEARIREYAVMALSRSDDVGTPRFIGLYDGTDDKRIKLTLIRVLSDRAGSESAAVDKLISIARTETDTDLRKSAVLGLPSNDPRARELLLEILRGGN